MGKLGPRFIAALVTFCVGVSAASVWIIHRHSQPRKAESDARIESKVPADTLILLERTGCYGTCPGYTLTVAADGTVVFNATSYWVEEDGMSRHKQSGVIISRVSQDQVRRLIAEFEKADYFSLRDSYKNDEGCPGGIATDMPTAHTAIRIDGRMKAIWHYHGCVDKGDMFKVYPPKLTELENRIDEIVNTGQWMK